MLGKLSDWDNLPCDKSLFYTPFNCGLPIGNLSSQLFSNIYLNTFDQFMKRELCCHHYGRYVDDAYVVSRDRDFLKSIIPRLGCFLKQNLHLEIHPYKTHIVDVKYGVEFLGAYIMPYRTYISNESLRRIKHKVIARKSNDGKCIQSSINSFLGVLSHYDSYCLRRILLRFIPY